MSNARPTTVMEAVMKGMNGGAEPPVIVQKDVRYESAIDALIEAATEAANLEAGPELTAPAALWSRAFHTAMDRLAHERGLRTASWLAK